MLSTIVEATASTRADLWRRYHALILDALEPPAEHPALPGRPPDGDEMMAIIERWRPQPRRFGARG